MCILLFFLQRLNKIVFIQEEFAVFFVPSSFFSSVLLHDFDVADQASDERSGLKFSPLQESLVCCTSFSTAALKIFILKIIEFFTDFTSDFFQILKLCSHVVTLIHHQRLILLRLRCTLYKNFQVVALLISWHTHMFVDIYG